MDIRTAPLVILSTSAITLYYYKQRVFMCICFCPFSNSVRLHRLLTLVLELFGRKVTAIDDLCGQLVNRIRDRTHSEQGKRC